MECTNTGNTRQQNRISFISEKSSLSIKSFSSRGQLYVMFREMRHILFKFNLPTMLSYLFVMGLKLLKVYPINEFHITYVIATPVAKMLIA